MYPQRVSAFEKPSEMLSVMMADIGSFFCFLGMLITGFVLFLKKIRYTKSTVIMLDTAMISAEILL